jgi:hypothetical protein
LSINKQNERMVVSIPATMRALRQASLGGPQDLRLVLGLGQPAIHELDEGPKTLVELEARAIVSKLALVS